MEEHLAPDDLQHLDALMRDPREAARVGAHTRRCEACAAAVEAHMAPRIDAVLEAATKAAAEPPHSKVAWLAGLAAAAVIAAVIAMTLLRRPAEVTPKAAAPVAVTPTPAVDSRWDALIRQALDGTLPRPPVLDRVQPASRSVRSETTTRGDEPRVEYPAGVVVADARPQFRWQGVRGATYVVQVFTTALERVAESAPIRETSWLIPHDLPRGRDYAWQVQVRRDGHTSHTPPARFHVLEADAVREIAAAAATGRPFVLAVVEARYGLLAEAERELAASAEVPQTDRDRVTKLIQSWRRTK